jgi:hypothetical protein
MRRLPLRVLVASVVLGLLTGVTAVVVAAGGDERPAASAVSPGVESEAVRLLRAWDERRARAYARGDPAGLAALYVPGSRTGAADVAALRAYVARGLRVTGMRTQVLGAAVLRRTARRLVVEVTDVLLGAVARSGERGWTLPRDQPTQRRVVLVREDGRWQVEEAYRAD